MANHYSGYSSGNCDSFQGTGTITSNGYNMADNSLGDSGSSCGFSSATHDVGDSAHVGNLASNGGPTQTVALGPGSAASDAIPASSGLCSGTDQRGFTRPDDGESRCDIGAYESTYHETTTVLTSSPDPSVAHQAVTYTATVSPVPDGGTVWFTDSASGAPGQAISSCEYQPVNTTTGAATCVVTYPLYGSHTITATYSGDSAYDASGSNTLTQTVNPAPFGPPQQVADCSFATLQSDLQAGGAYYYTPGQCPNPIVFTGTITISQDASLTAQGNDIELQSQCPECGGEWRVQLFAVTGSFDLSGLTLSWGSDYYNPNEGGGAIYNAGTMTITNSTFHDNQDTSVEDATPVPPNGFGGGAIFNAGTMTITNSNFHDNVSAQVSTLGGGAIYNTIGTLTIRNSTFNHNWQVGGFGGAILNEAGFPVTITNSTFRANNLGGGAQLAGSGFTISGTIIDGAGGANCGGGIVGDSQVTDDGYNLEDDAGASCGFSAARHDIVGQDPQLVAGWSGRGIKGA
jgi:hypothetical protein